MPVCLFSFITPVFQVFVGPLGFEEQSWTGTKLYTIQLGWTEPKSNTWADMKGSECSRYELSVRGTS